VHPSRPQRETSIPAPRAWSRLSSGRLCGGAFAKAAVAASSMATARWGSVPSRGGQRRPRLFARADEIEAGFTGAFRRAESAVLGSRRRSAQRAPDKERCDKRQAATHGMIFATVPRSACDVRRRNANVG
jgi:hypothetical protein